MVIHLFSNRFQFPITKKGLQGRWPQALALFFIPIILFFSFRWLCFEPFVIPSESMQPNLFIHDHILVKKMAYGIKPPFGDGWWWRWDSEGARPQRGDVVVFRYPENREIFYIKRLIGLPGDQIKVNGMNLTVNGKLYDLEPMSQAGLFEENNSTKKYSVQFIGEAQANDFENKDFIVPEASYFVMGDNRYNSHDSRFWGVVPEELLVGKAQWVWLSCQETLASMPFVCNPTTIRADRLFMEIK